MSKALKVYTRPGKLQIGVVFLICLVVLVVAAYIGILLLMDEPIISNLQWLQEEIQSYFR